MAIYESIVILDSLMPPKEIDSAVERFSGMITANGGKVRTVDKWGKKRLAYEIQKKQYGFYVAIEFEGEGNIPRELESEYNYNDKVIRFLTYRYDKRKLKVMEQDKETEKAEAAEKAQPEAPVPAPKETKTEAAPAEKPAEETAAPAEAEETKE